MHFLASEQTLECVRVFVHVLMGCVDKTVGVQTCAIILYLCKAAEFGCLTKL